MNTLKAAAIAFFAIASVPAYAAGANTGYTLLTICEPDPNDPDRYVSETFCAGYLSGVWEGAEHGISLAGGTRPPWCEDDSHTRTGGQLVLIYRRWAHRNPQFLDKPSVLAVLAAFTSAFPCQH